MKLFTAFLVFIACFNLPAASAADEKAFTEKYKTAFEAKDTKTLESFLYTTGSDSSALEFYKMMMTGEAGAKISQIELVALTPEEAKKAKEPQDGPTGKLCLTLSPTKKLVIKVEQKDANGSSTSTSSSFVAEKDGKLVIPVPGACKQSGTKDPTSRKGSGRIFGSSDAGPGAKANGLAMTSFKA